jgi:UDP-N-acetylmuramoyl-L-alanyl-D-glutamate--2,6-diaminopimelate ligase
MELSELIEELNRLPRPDAHVRVTVGTTGVDVSSITHDSRHVVAGSIFACLRGATSDGHTHAVEALASGATALLVDHQLDLAVGVPQLVVTDTRRALGPIAAAVNGYPSRALTTVGITGTNGKTTTAQLTAAIFEHTGCPTGVVGTLHGPRTTPEAPELQATLAGFVADGKSAAVLEVSSHALAMHRVDGTTFDAVVFTNLGRDHLDLHGSTEEYFRAKARLFDGSFAPLAIICVDDLHGRLLADTVRGSASTRLVTVSTDDVTDIEVTGAGHSYRWHGLDVTVPIGGRFNVRNSLAALVTAVELGIDVGVAIDALAEVPAIPGRFESVADAQEVGFTVIVDYAHTPDGLAEVLSSARAIADSGAPVVVVFGAGGERDHDKRAEMGRVAQELADHVVVTSDNPRREDPAGIIDDILAGMERNHQSDLVSATEQVSVVSDRREAIATALDVVSPGGVVVIAGKGHETTQDLGTSTIDFDDRQIARELLQAAIANTQAEERS